MAVEAHVKPCHVKAALLVAKGYTNRQVARALHISYSSACSYVQYVYLVWGVHNHQELLIYCLHKGLLDLDALGRELDARRDPLQGCTVERARREYEAGA